MPDGSQRNLDAPYATLKHLDVRNKVRDPDIVLRTVFGHVRDLPMPFVAMGDLGERISLHGASPPLRTPPAPV